MSRNLAPDRLAELARAHELVYLPGGVSIPVPFIDDLLAKPDLSRNLRILTSIAPGVDNPLDIDRLDPSATVTGLFMQPGLTAAQRSGRYRALPMSYGGFVRYLTDQVDIDLVVVQVAPPDSEGRCSLGPSVEFMPSVLPKSRRVLGLINRRILKLRGAVSIPFDRFDFVCEVDTPLLEYSTDSDEPTRVIASHIASLISDGCALQTGLGKVPTALAPLLRNHRNLRLHSGMLSDGMMELAQAGALDPDFAHTTCVVAGTERLYRWSETFDGLHVLGCEVTHNARTIAALDHFVAVNSALEVDLFGQCNLEHADGRAISGAGGAPDFARAARLSSGGRSIVALNASFKRGQVSRIVPCLGESAITSLARVDVDYVITEFGAADLRAASVHERAQALIAISAPQFRDELQRAWHAIAARL
ncbi:MAG: acetyl-CoA hydrolase/transferase C-terminal domain-containing protein [Sulfuricaulis sp.]|nr:acetyl-CoA hydrolase/transferase C-terminal domain-containing protein [Sulfuricaulis sp.]